jgi:UDP-N-acetylmuramate--alanine ligase
MELPHKKSCVHFIGMGGIGMSALARYFKYQKYIVSGSDRVRSDMTSKLSHEGIKVFIGHASSNLSRDISLVIYNRAIPKDNQELVAARVRKLKTIPYAEALGELTKKYKTIAITGSHGKSTTTAITGLVLAHSGLDPTVFVGTELKEFKGKNIRVGKSPYMVLEADDFGKAFLDYSPTIALITNIDREHFDTYPTLKSAQKSFLQFLERVKENGTFILNKDDKNLFSLRANISKIAKAKRARIIWYSISARAALRIKKVMGIPGVHNLSNAMGAYSVARVLGIPESKILSSISKYHGAWRRMEYRGVFHGAKVYDDYAHHPTEIKATLQAFKEKYPNKKILCVFQPHQARRLQALFKEFQSVFDLADKTIILPIYAVAGRDEKAKLDSEALVRAIQKKQPKKLLFYLGQPKNLKKALLQLVAKNQWPNTVLIMMGAGNIVKYTDQFLKQK